MSTSATSGSPNQQVITYTLSDSLRPTLRRSQTDETEDKNRAPSPNADPNHTTSSKPQSILEAEKQNQQASIDAKLAKYPIPLKPKRRERTYSELGSTGGYKVQPSSRSPQRSREIVLGSTYENYLNHLLQKAVIQNNLDAQSLLQRQLDKLKGHEKSELSDHQRSMYSWTQKLIFDDQRVNTLILKKLKELETQPLTEQTTLSWCRRAAEDGESSAQFILAMHYYEGREVKQDWDQTVALLKKAALQGHLVAQHNLGLCYYGGQGVKKDKNQARLYFAEAAEQGLPEALLYLGILAYELPDRDEKSAFLLFEKAAQRGCVEAQYNMGVFYFEGIGVEKNKTRAIFWFQQADEGGHEKAKETLQNMMT
ncbi:MAG TPA: tetratricopeptide repeat protein, partial [Rhabdochlamydiaceae bacterium]|nr:tetratricopeptide repeat protein [Rhabdochlamydiaceae bacterium]